jgi:hypothetical protein
MSAYYAAPGNPAAATGQEELAPVLVAFAGPAPQSRLTVLIRLLMVIPHLVVLWALAIAAYVVVIIGWFGALFTGRLPDFAADFLAGFVRWQTRVLGYAILLTDVYPPFTLEDVDYPIRVAVRPGRLNRLAVLFRFFLLIPAWIVESVVSYGAFTLVQLVSWLIVLISGRMPDSLYQALAAALRYQARVVGFAFMLTSAYPSGLYGDLVPAAPAWPQPGFGTFGAQPGYGAPAAGTGPETSMASWWLVLSSGAKNLVTTFIVLGVVFAAGEGVLQASITGHAVSAAEASIDLHSDTNTINSVLRTYPTEVKNCQTVSCAAGPNTTVANAYDNFASEVRAIPMPNAQTSTDAANLASAAAHEGSIYRALATATSPSQYQSITSGLTPAINQLNRDYTTLTSNLSNS